MQQNKNLAVSLLELILANVLIFLELSMKYLDILNNQIKKTLVNKISARLSQLQFESDNITKSKAIKNIVKAILPDYQ